MRKSRSPHPNISFIAVKLPLITIPDTDEIELEEGDKFNETEDPKLEVISTLFSLLSVTHGNVTVPQSRHCLHS